MKKTVLAIAFIMTTIGFMAQENAIETHFKNYLQNENFTKIEVSGTIFQLANYIEAEDQETEEFKDFVSSINRFHMIIGEDELFQEKDLNRAVSKVEKEYEELMSIEDKDGRFNFRIKEKNGVVQELIMLALSENDLLIFSLSGKMDLRQLSKMGADLQMDGMEHLSKIKENQVEDISLYPNPIDASERLKIKVPESFVGGTARLLDYNGRELMSYPMTKKRQELDLGRVSPGQYLMEFNKEGLSVSKKLQVN